MHFIEILTQIIYHVTVVNSKGELSGAFAFGGAGQQEELLKADGIEVVNGKVDLKVYSMKF